MSVAVVDPSMSAIPARWVVFEPLGHEHEHLVRRAELAASLGARWRHRGATPSPEAFAHGLWAGVLAQYVVRSRTDGEPLGLACAYGADLQSGTCLVAFARFVPGEPSPAFVEAMVRFVDHLFASWPFRKLCAEVIAPNLSSFATVLEHVAVEEGRWRAQVRVDGTHEDVVLLALWRERWEDVRQSLLPDGASA